MGADHSHKANEHSPRHGAAQRERETHRHPTGEPTHDTGSRPAASVLGTPMLGGRGNQSVQIAMMQEMQQAYGNRAVQRFMQRRAGLSNDPAQAPIARAGDKPVQRDPKPDDKTAKQTSSDRYVVLYLFGADGQLLDQRGGLRLNIEGIPTWRHLPLQSFNAISTKDGKYEAVVEFEVNGAKKTEEVVFNIRKDQDAFAQAFQQHKQAVVMIVDPANPPKVDPKADKDKVAPGGGTVGSGQDKSGKSSQPDQAGGGGSGDSTGTGTGTGKTPGSKYGFLGLLHLPDSVNKLIEKAFEAMGGTEEYLAMMSLLRNLNDLDELMPEFKSLLDTDKLLGIMLGIEDNKILNKLETWAMEEPPKKAVAAKSSSANGLTKLAGKVMKVLSVTRKILRPIFKIRAGAQKVFAAATGLLEELPELEDLLGLSTDKTKAKSGGFDELMSGISTSASRLVHSKLIDVRTGFALRLEKLDLISAKDVASAIMAALLPLIPWRYRVFIKPFKNVIANNLLDKVIPNSVLDTINSKLQGVLDPLVKGAEKLLDEALNKVEGAIHDHLLPELKLAIQPTPASKAIEFGKKIAPLMTAGIKATKAASNDPKKRAEAAKITKQASKLITDKTIINDSSPPKLPTAFDGKEEVYKYIKKNGEIVNIKRSLKWVLLGVPKLGVAGKKPKRIVGGLLSNPAMAAFEEADLKKAKATFGKQLFWREDVQDTLGVSKSTANDRINAWKKAGVLFLLESGKFDPETQYSFDREKAGQREVSPGNRSKYGYSNPKKESDVGLQILSKGLNPVPAGDETSREFHTKKARYHSMRLGSRYKNFGFAVAILGHGKEGASEHWNRIGHKQSKEKNKEWNYNPKNYQGPEHEYESSASGGSSDRYMVPSKHHKSHPDWL